MAPQIVGISWAAINKDGLWPFDLRACKWLERRCRERPDRDSFKMQELRRAEWRFRSTADLLFGANGIMVVENVGSIGVVLRDFLKAFPTDRELVFILTQDPYFFSDPTLYPHLVRMLLGDDNPEKSILLDFEPVIHSETACGMVAESIELPTREDFAMESERANKIAELIALGHHVAYVRIAKRSPRKNQRGISTNT